MNNLLLALMWVIGAAVAIFYQSISEEGFEKRRFYIILLLALLMIFYNLLRWFLQQRTKWRRRAARVAADAALVHQPRRPAPSGPPDPAFDFTNSEPPPLPRTNGPGPSS